MNRTRRVAFALLAFVGVAGCQSAPAPEAPPSEAAPKTAEERIKAIEANPDMPAEAKAAALQQIRGGGASGKAAQEDAGRKK